LGAKEVVLQSRMNCSVGEVPFTVQPLFVGTVFLVVEVDALALDSFKLVVLCTECVYIGHDAGIP